LRSNFQEHIIPIEKKGEEDKAKNQLIAELQQLRKETAELEKSRARQEQVEMKLRESEEELNSIFENAKDCLIFLDRLGRIRRVNEKAVQVYGGTKNELLGKYFFSLGVLPPKTLLLVRKSFKHALEKNKLALNDVPIKNKKGKVIYLETLSTILRKDHKIKGMLVIARDITERKIIEGELRKHQERLEELVEERAAKLKTVNVELEREVGERKRAEEELRESEEKFRTISASALDAIIMVDSQGEVSYWNDAAEKIFGYTKEEALGKPVKIILPERFFKAFNKGFRRFRKTGKGPKVERTLEWTARRKDGSEFPVELSLASVNIKGKWNAIGIIRDITRRKKTEEALRASEARFKELWNNAPAAYHTLNPEGIITSVNQTEAKLLGYSPQEMVGESIFEFILPEQRNEARTRFKQKISGKHVPRAEGRIYVKKDGSKVYVVIDDVLEQDSNGRLIGVRTTMVDITEVKQAEKLLRQSEEKYRLLAENAMDGIYIISPAGFEYVNPAFEKIFRYKEKEVCNRKFNFFDLIHPDDRALVARREASRQKGETLSPQYSFRILTKDKKIKYVEVNTVPLYGEKLRVLGILRDITRRKIDEEALRESEEKYRSLVEQSRYGIAIIQDGIFKYVNRRLAEIGGFSVKELIGFPSKKFISAANHSKANNYHRRRIAGEDVRPVYELEVRKKDGEKIYIEFNARTITYNGRPADLVVVQDISDRKKAEEDVRESKERYKDLVEKAGVAILVDDKEGKVRYCNKNYADLFGYSIEEMKKQMISTLVHADEVERVTQYHRGRIEGKDIPSRYECRAVRKDRSIIHIEINAAALRENGNIIGTRCYIWDVTERKKAEEAILASEEKFRTLFNSASDAIFIHDLRGRFLEVNKVACERLGYSREGLLKMTLMDIDLPEYAVQMPQRIRELRRKGHIFFETALVGRDNTILPIELNSRIIDYEGKTAALSIARDITERKRAEEERKNSFERLRRALEETVNALSSAVEMRDPYTAGHQRRVTNLACTIAREMGLPNEQIEGIRMAGIIHDVGKIRVPAEILSWPGRLNEIDFNLIKTHPQVGYDIIKKIELPHSVAQIMLQHHERLDGSGYPAGLKANEILLEAKILAVADVVEAMASHRPYRAALGIDKALEEISKNKGILYDPDVVEACCRTLSKKKFRRNISKRTASS
jgi:PAS domain S-box-containing protein/putative nucleotidyltransferase with HDIG domain